MDLRGEMPLGKPILETWTESGFAPRPWTMSDVPERVYSLRR